MIGDFDTDDTAAAIGALLVYSVYRSRDVKRFKVDTSLWARIERFTKASAKRSQSLSEFVERLKPRLACEAIRATADGDGYRDFLTGVLSRPDADPHLVLRRLYRETSLCVLLVRERLEREKAERLAREAAKLASGADNDDDGIEDDLAA
jgi:hypothetical protein